MREPRAEDHRSRRSGRTLAMVKELPSTGAIVIVHTVAMREYLRRMIFDIRGAETLKHTNIKVVTQPVDADSLHGVSLPIYTDHAWWEVVGDQVSVATCAAVRRHMERSRIRAQRS
jgi:hypothetical protein